MNPFLPTKPIFLDDLWLPPEGHSFANLFATTYSVHESVIGVLALNFVPEAYRRRIDPTDRNSLKDTLITRIGDNFKVLYDRSALQKSGKLENSKYGIFARYLKEVIPRNMRNGTVRFHPKVYWAIYKNDITHKIDCGRIIISSQNLTTASDCLEAGYVFDFILPSKKKKAKKHEKKFVKNLEEIIRPWAGDRQTNELFKNTSRMIFSDLPGDIKDMRIFNTKNSSLTLDKILKVKDASLAVLVSPFVHLTQLKVLNSYAEKNKCKIGIITRDDTLQGLIPDEFTEKNSYPYLVFGNEAALSSKTRPLHAKLSLIRGKDHNSLILGSSNLTAGGWGRNDEINLEFKLTNGSSNIKSIIDLLKPLSKVKATMPGVTSLEDEGQKICAWICGWAISWKKASKSKSLTDVPLSILTTDCPDDVWTIIRKHKLTIRTGSIESKPIKLSKIMTEIPLAAINAFTLEDINPLVEIQLGAYSQWILPNYEFFPAKKEFEAINVEDLIQSLSLLMRSSQSRKKKTPKKKTGRTPDTDSSQTYEVDVEKILVSYFKEHLPNGIDEESKKIRASEIRGWISRVRTIEDVSHRKLILALQGIANILDPKRSGK